MSKTGKDKDESVLKTGEHDSQIIKASNDNASDPSVQHNEMSAIKVDDGTDIETSKGDSTVMNEGAVNEAAIVDKMSVDPDQSEEQSDDSHPKDVLKRTTTSASDKPYSSFTPWQKRFIILSASVGSFISPLTSNIYLPALTTIASDLHVSISQVNLTITTYMVGILAFSVNGDNYTNRH